MLRTPIVSALALLLSTAFCQIRVQVDGEGVRFPNQPPIQVNNTVLVPLRGVFERLGADVRWVPAEQEVRAVRGETSIRLNIGSDTAYVNGQPRTLLVPPRLLNGTTLVPLRFLSESLGADVKWNSSEQLVSIYTGRDPNAPVDPVYPPRPPRPEPPVPPPPRPENREIYISRYTVLAVRLGTPLSSRSSRYGDAVYVTVTDRSSTGWRSIPAGTRIEGRVVGVTPSRRGEPGLVAVLFETLAVPGARPVRIVGSPISLQPWCTARNREGQLEAIGTWRTLRTVFAGYNNQAFIFGFPSNYQYSDTLNPRALDPAGLRSSRAVNQPSDFNLRPGATGGVRLDQDVRIRY